MKQVFISFLSVGIILISACNFSSKKSAEQSHDMAGMDKDTMQQAMADTSNIKTVAVIYSNVDPAIAASMVQVTNHYLHIKNALAKDDASEAASGGSALQKAFRSIDKSLLTADQKKTWDELEEEMQEHAEHIGKNGDKIKHQREHFASLSEDMYTLVKTFGAGQPLYHDHCPMYNENKGAMWLSETKEISNPYLGTEMPTCGNVEEVIK